MDGTGTGRSGSVGGAPPAGAVGAAPAAVDSALAAWRGRGSAGGRWRRAMVGVAMVVAVAAAWRMAGVDLGRLVQGLPRMGHWLAQAWPPAVDELPVFGLRMAETVSIAFLGTLVAVLAAVPAALLAARGTAPWPALRWPLRGLLNAFRGIDSFVFALIFVAAVGLGPFAGLIGVALHTWGSAAKLFAEQVESVSLETSEALAVGGSGRLLAIRHALLPELAPAWASQALYLFEFNVRASTVLGVVGAGGIGHELKASMDLLDFARLATILAVILMAVTVIDAGSAWLRRRLV